MNKWGLKRKIKSNNEKIHLYKYQLEFDLTNCPTKLKSNLKKIQKENNHLRNKLKKLY